MCKCNQPLSRVMPWSWRLYHLESLTFIVLFIMKANCHFSHFPFKTFLHILSPWLEKITTETVPASLIPTLPRIGVWAETKPKGWQGGAKPAGWKGACLHSFSCALQGCEQRRRGMQRGLWRQKIIPLSLIYFITTCSLMWGFKYKAPGFVVTFSHMGTSVFCSHLAPFL